MLKTIKSKALLAAPALAAVSSFAAGGGETNWNSEATVTSAVSDIVTFGGYVLTGIAGVIGVAAGLRLLVKGINRAVGK